MVPASPNFICHFLQERYRRDYFSGYVCMFYVDVMCMFCIVFNLYAKFELVKSPEVTLGQEDQTAEHILQRCPNHDSLRRITWPTETALHVDKAVWVQGRSDCVNCERAKKEEVLSTHNLTLLHVPTHLSCTSDKTESYSASIFNGLVESCWCDLLKWISQQQDAGCLLVRRSWLSLGLSWLNREGRVWDWEN